MRSLRLLALVSAAIGLLTHIACSGTTLPFLQHLKHPQGLATVRITDAATARYQMYVANADIDRLAVIDVTQRSLVIDPSKNTPGILYIPTGRRPIDVAASPDHKRLYVLHAIDGNLRVYDTATNQPLQSGNQPLQIPTDCARQPGCWSGALRVKVYQQQNPARLLGFVALAGEKAVAVVNLDESDQQGFGKEISRIRLTGQPSDMWFDADRKNLYVSNAKEPFVHVIEAETQSVRHLAVTTPTLTGSASLDNKWLYLIDAKDNSILIYDLTNNKVTPQGDQRFPDETNIRISTGSFLRVQFLPPISVTVRDVNGNDRILTKSFAWANASDGHGYLLDPDPYTLSDNSKTFPAHRLLDTDETGPSVSNIRVRIGEDSLGDPRQPIRPFIPRLVTTSTNENGITLLRGQTRTETWSLVYEGPVVNERSGSFTDLTNGTFADIQQLDLSKEGVQKGDLLVLQNCGTASNIPDGGTGPDQAPPVPICELEITNVDSYLVTVDASKLPDAQQNQAQWTYSIRSSKNYVATGSVTGRLDKRIQEGVLFASNYFLLQIDANTEPTQRDTTITFEALSGVAIKRLRLGGLPTAIMPQANHLSCGGNLCNLENCRTHPSCTNTPCEANTEDTTKRCSSEETCNNGKCEANTKLWILDSPGGRLFVVNPTSAVTLETTIR